MAIPYDTVILCLGIGEQTVDTYTEDNRTHGRLDCPDGTTLIETYTVYQCSTTSWQGVYNQAICIDGVWQDVTESLTVGDGVVVEPPPDGFDISQLDPTVVAGMTGLGFFFLLPLWAAAFGVKAIIKIISLR